MKEGTIRSMYVRKFRIFDISPVFAHINNGKLNKFGEGDIYTCKDDELSSKLVEEGLISEVRSDARYYAVEEGRFVKYETKNRKNKGENVEYLSRTAITDNFYLTIEEDIGYDNGIEKYSIWKGNMIIEGNIRKPYEIDSTRFATSPEIAKVLLEIGSSLVMFDNSILKDVRLAMQETSQPKKRDVFQTFGFRNNDVYESKSTIISRKGIITLEKGEGEVDLNRIPYAKYLDISSLSDKDFKRVGKHIKDDLLHIHGSYLINSLVGFTFLAPFTSKIVVSPKWSGDRIGLWLTGLTGSGKSFAASLFQCFFGEFMDDGSIVSWTSTPNAIQVMGYYFNDALYLVDDFKIGHFSQQQLNGVVMIFQNYTDGRARGRLTATIEMREGKHIRGSMIITGEDILHNEASIMARYHIISVDKAKLNFDAGQRALEYRHLYSGFMGRYIEWFIKHDKYVEKTVDRINREKKLFIGGRNTTNVTRVGQSFAYNLVGFEMFCSFMEDSGFITREEKRKMIKFQKDDLEYEFNRSATDASSAAVGEVFLEAVSSLIDSQDLRIHNGDTEVSNMENDKINYAGFDKNENDPYLYFFPKRTCKIVSESLNIKGNTFNFTVKSLTDDLLGSGHLRPGQPSRRDNCCSVVYQGKARGVMGIRKDALGFDEPAILSESCDIDEYDEEW